MKFNFKPSDLFFFIGLVMCFTTAVQGQKSPVKSNNQSNFVNNTWRATEAETWYLQTEDKASYLFIHEIGKGETVVVLHGGPGAGYRYLTDIVKGLENQFRFVLYDQRGAGYSFAAKENISMPNNVQDLETLRKALGLKKMNLISHSAGTYLAMEYLRNYPQNVKNLVLVGATDPKNGDLKFFTEKEIEAYKLHAQEAKRFIERAEVQQEIRKAGLDTSNLSPKQEYQLWRIESAAGSIYKIDRWRQNIYFVINRDAALGAREGMNFVYDWSKILSAHPHPITVINGEYDYAVGLKGSPIWKRVAATEAKNVKVVVIEKASHNVWIDEPITFRNALRDALTRKR